MTLFFRLWLLWQSVLVSLLILSVFFGFRSYIQLQKLREEVRLIRSLVLVWATTWGQTPELVREALSKCITGLTEHMPMVGDARDPRPPETETI